jgi:hypothetical protein
VPVVDTSSVGLPSSFRESWMLEVSDVVAFALFGCPRMTGSPVEP